MKHEPKKEGGARRALLLAANRISRTQGVAAMTLEAVAKEAGVSKGGLLYHFPSKDALIEGLLQLAVESFDELMEEELKKEPEGTPGRWTRALIHASLNNYGEEQVFSNLGLIEAAATNPELLAGVRQHYQGWYEKVVNDGLDPALAMIIYLATDGYWMSCLLQMSPTEFVDTEALRERLLELAQPPTRPAQKSAKGKSKK